MSRAARRTEPPRWDCYFYETRTSALGRPSLGLGGRSGRLMDVPALQ
jgi:hypothetical protein